MKQSSLVIVMILCGSFMFTRSFGSHLRGGSLTYKTIDPVTRTVEFKLALYRDTEGVDQPQVTLYFGDGSACRTVLFKDANEVYRVSAETEVIVFTFKHNYPAAGKYRASFNEENRNSNIVNINDGKSANISYYISTIVSLEDVANNSFLFHEKPVMNAALGKPFSHTIMGFDPDGDSIAFKWTIPKAYASGENCSVGEPFDVPGYFLPDSISINPFSGNIKWIPRKLGEYVFAVKVEEYKKGKLVAYALRDFEIVVTDANTSAEFRRLDNTVTEKYNVINLGVGKPLELKVLFKDASATSNLEAYSELLVKGNATSESYDSAGYKVGKFKFVLSESTKRDQPYVVSFLGMSEKPFSPDLRNDLSFVLNTVPGRGFEYDSTQTREGIILAAKKDQVFIWSAFPNPARSHFTINTAALADPEITIINPAGAIAAHYKLERSENAIVERNSLSPGIYFYRVTSKGQLKGKGKIVFE